MPRGRGRRSAEADPRSRKGDADGRDDRHHDSLAQCRSRLRAGIQPATDRRLERPPGRPAARADDRRRRVRRRQLAGPDARSGRGPRLSRVHLVRGSRSEPGADRGPARRPSRPQDRRLLARERHPDRRLESTRPVTPGSPDQLRRCHRRGLPGRQNLPDCVVYDTAYIMRRLDILPRPRSLGERAIVALANLQTQLRRR